MKKIIALRYWQAIAVRGGTGTLTFDWIHADTAAALSAGTTATRLDAAITNGGLTLSRWRRWPGYATTGTGVATANLDETTRGP